MKLYDNSEHFEIHVVSFICFSNNLQNKNVTSYKSELFVILQILVLHF